MNRDMTMSQSMELDPRVSDLCQKGHLWAIPRFETHPFGFIWEKDSCGSPKRKILQGYVSASHCLMNFPVQQAPWGDENTSCPKPAWGSIVVSLNPLNPQDFVGAKSRFPGGPQLIPVGSPPTNHQFSSISPGGFQCGDARSISI